MLWKDIDGYNNYEVNEDGEIRNKINGLIRKKGKCSDGYCRINLFEDGKRKSELVHRIVAKAFLPNEDKKTTVNHIDGNKSNNKVCNLEWSTPKEQINHAIKNGLINKNTWAKACEMMSKANNKKVVCINNGLIFESIKEASIYFDKSRTSISRNLRGLSTNCGKDKKGNFLKFEYYRE